MAYGFGSATNKNDPLRSPEHDFHIGVWKVDASPGEVCTGRLVKRTAAGKIKIQGAPAAPGKQGPIGVCRRRTLQASSGDRNPTYSRTASAFVENDEVEVASPKPGALLELLLVSGDNGVAGDKVRFAADGKVTLYAPDVTATVNEANVETALAQTAAIVGVLADDCDASAADTACLVKWGLV